jgi:hypothetical protein
VRLTSPRESEEVAPTSDRMPERPKGDEDQADHQQDDSDRPDDRGFGDEADDEQDDSQEDHLCRTSHLVSAPGKPRALNLLMPVETED